MNGITYTVIIHTYAQLHRAERRNRPHFLSSFARPLLRQEGSGAFSGRMHKLYSATSPSRNFLIKLTVQEKERSGFWVVSEIRAQCENKALEF